MTEMDSRRGVDWADKVKAEILEILESGHLFPDEKADEVMHIVVRERAGMLDQCRFEFLQGGRVEQADGDID